MKYLALVLLFASLCLGQCQSPPTPPLPPTDRALTPSQESELQGNTVIHFVGHHRRILFPLRPGESLQLAAEAITAADRERKSQPRGRQLVASEVTWRSTDTRVATIDVNGLVTAVGPGAAHITASCTICGSEAKVGNIGFWVETQELYSPASSQERY